MNITQIAPTGETWWVIAETPASTVEVRRWCRTRVAAWAVEGVGIADVVPLVAGRFDDGTQCGAPILVPATGYLVADGDLWRCECTTPDEGTLSDEGWCMRCTGTIS